MSSFKKVLDIFIGVSALVIMAGLIIFAFNKNYDFMDEVVLTDIIHYALPILVGLVCLRFTCGKIIWFILTILLVAFALWVYFDTTGFFNFAQSIFG